MTKGGREMSKCYSGIGRGKNKKQKTKTKTVVNVALGAHTIHNNLNTIFYTHMEHMQFPLIQFA